jgi:TolB protein
MRTMLPAVRALVRTSSSDQTGCWSPDNRRLSFVSDRDGNPELYTLDALGRGAVRLTHTPATERAAVWSPDGRRLAYTAEDETHTEIYVMNADGTGAHPLIGTRR